MRQAAWVQQGVRPAVRMRQGNELLHDSVQDGPLSSDLALGLSLDLDPLRCEGAGGAQRHGPPPAVWERTGQPR